MIDTELVEEGVTTTPEGVEGILPHAEVTNTPGLVQDNVPEVNPLV